MIRDQVSVVMPLYNTDLCFLIETLKTIIRNEDGLIKEIILVDDGSASPLSQFVGDFYKISRKIKIIRQENKGPGGARNAGVKIVKTRIVVFLDHDCRPDRNWIKNLIEPIINGEIVAVGGTVLTYKEDNIISEFADFRELLRRPVKNQNLKITNVITASSAFLVDIFNEVDGFDENLNIAAEDVDLTYKLINRGYQDRLTYSPLSIVFHKHRSNLKDFCMQQYGYGFGSVSHCLYRNRDPREIGFTFPTPINVMKYVLSCLTRSVKLSKSVDSKKYGIVKKFILFPLIEYIRNISILTGGIKMFYNKGRTRLGNRRFPREG